ncbi:MAG: hypothetical protein RL885_02035 [Planctomycetota bacterium]
MNASGIAMMAISFTLVIGLVIFCITKVMSESKPTEHVHGPLDIDTKDTDA